MKMNRDHEAFDLTMELACCLSADFLPLELIRQDLDLKTIGEVHDLLDDLRKRGFRLAGGYLSGAEGVAVGLAAVSVVAMGDACRMYWRVVYGGDWVAVDEGPGLASRRGGAVGYEA